MGSSHVTSHGPDWRDVVATLEAFESINKVTMEVSVTLVRSEGMCGLCLRGTARTGVGVPVELAPSASVLLHHGSSSFRTMEAALLNLLYQIDGQLAERAWEESKNKSA